MKVTAWPRNPDGSGPWVVSATTVESKDPRLQMGGSIICPDEKMANDVMTALSTVKEG